MLRGCRALGPGSLAHGARAGGFVRWDAFLTTDPSLSAMRAKAAALLGGEDKVPYFDWDAPRAREGYYRVSPSTEYAIARAKAFAPHSDLLWMETAEPDVQQARAFAQRVREAYPEQWLAYFRGADIPCTNRGDRDVDIPWR